MSLESRIYAALAASTALTAAVGANIYPETRPAASGLPAVVFQRAGGYRVNSLQGYSGLENAICAVSVYSTSLDGRRSVAEAAAAALTASTAFNCLQEDSPDDFYDDEVQLYERRLTFSIWNQDT